MLGQPGLSGCVHGKEWELPLPYSKNTAECKVWGWCALLALKRCNLSLFAIYFKELHGYVGGLCWGGAVFSVNVFLIN